MLLFNASYFAYSVYLLKPFDSAFSQDRNAIFVLCIVTTKKLLEETVLWHDCV